MDKGKLFEGQNKVLTPEFRVSFPHIFEKDDFGNDPAYTITMVFDEDKVDLDSMKALVKQAASEKWGAKVPKFRHDIFKEGDDEYTEGKIVVKAKNKFKQPVLVDAGKVEIINPEEFYGGCYARATLSASAYENEYGKGVTFVLLAVQKLRDGEPLGGGAAGSADDFDPVEDF